MTIPTVPFITPAEMLKRTLGVLEECEPSRPIPIPIEKIIQKNYCIFITPIPGLRTTYDMDASISHDLSDIWIDEYVFTNLNSRYRFSLAHELAHVVLHKAVFLSMRFETIEEYKACLASIPSATCRTMETQANMFAGMLLVPPQELASIFAENIKKLEDGGIKFRGASDTVVTKVGAATAQKFDVSPDVIWHRLENDGLHFKKKNRS